VLLVAEVDIFPVAAKAFIDCQKRQLCGRRGLPAFLELTGALWRPVSSVRTISQPTVLLNRRSLDFLVFVASSRMLFLLCLIWSSHWSRWHERNEGYMLTSTGSMRSVIWRSVNIHY